MIFVIGQTKAFCRFWDGMAQFHWGIYQQFGRPNSRSSFYVAFRTHSGLLLARESSRPVLLAWPSKPAGKQAGSKFLWSWGFFLLRFFFFFSPMFYFYVQPFELWMICSLFSTYHFQPGPNTLISLSFLRFLAAFYLRPLGFPFCVPVFYTAQYIDQSSSAIQVLSPLSHL